MKIVAVSAVLGVCLFSSVRLSTAEDLTVT